MVHVKKCTGGFLPFRGQGGAAEIEGETFPFAFAFVGALAVASAVAELFPLALPFALAFAFAEKPDFLEANLANISEVMASILLGGGDFASTTAAPSPVAASADEPAPAPAPEAEAAPAEAASAAAGCAPTACMGNCG